MHPRRIASRWVLDPKRLPPGPSQHVRASARPTGTVATSRPPHVLVPTRHFVSGARFDDMKRRRALALTALFVSGCIESESGPTSRDDPPTSASESGTATIADDTTETETPSPVPSTTGDDCDWPVMCEGSTLVEVAVRSGFSGDVVLEVACRKEQYAVRPGETFGSTARRTARPAR